MKKFIECVLVGICIFNICAPSYADDRTVYEQRNVVSTTQTYQTEGRVGLIGGTLWFVGNAIKTVGDVVGDVLYMGGEVCREANIAPARVISRQVGQTIITEECVVSDDVVEYRDNCTTNRTVIGNVLDKYFRENISNIDGYEYRYVIVKEYYILNGTYNIVAEVSYVKKSPYSDKIVKYPIRTYNNSITGLKHSMRAMIENRIFNER